MAQADELSSHLSPVAGAIKMRNEFRQSLTRMGEGALAMSAIGAVFIGIVTLFGGKIPPWVTPAEAQAMQTIQQQTVQALEKLTGTVDKLATRIDRKDCEDLNDRYWRASDALAKNPADSIARDSFTAARDKIRETAGCTIDARPPPR